MWVLLVGIFTAIALVVAKSWFLGGMFWIGYSYFALEHHLGVCVLEGFAFAGLQFIIGWFFVFLGGATASLLVPKVLR